MSENLEWDVCQHLFCRAGKSNNYSLDNLRGDDLARTTPGREAVEDDELVLVLLHGLVKFGLVGQVVDALLAHCGGEESRRLGDDRFVCVLDRGCGC